MRLQGLLSCDCIEGWKQESSAPEYDVRVHVNKVEHVGIKLGLASYCKNTARKNWAKRFQNCTWVCPCLLSSYLLCTLRMKIVSHTEE